MLIVTIANTTGQPDHAILKQASAQLTKICHLAIQLGRDSVQVRSGELACPAFSPIDVLSILKCKRFEMQAL